MSLFNNYLLNKFECEAQGFLMRLKTINTN